ncbi:MAG TPA: hypothetical protein VI636_03765 [Candidatus Angelobacter sp.]
MAIAKAKRRPASKQHVPQYEDFPIYRKAKFPIYQSLFNLNAAFESIAFEIERLDDYEAVPLETLRLYRATAEELRSAMNHRVTGVLLGREEQDWYQYGKQRITTEQEINKQE